MLILLIGASAIALSDEALAQHALDARISIDASKVDGETSPTLYGQFDEFMFEGVKGGLSAELLKDRTFDGAPNARGLPRYSARSVTKKIVARIKRRRRETLDSTLQPRNQDSWVLYQEL